MKNKRVIITPGVIRVFVLTALWVGIGAYFGWHVYNLFRAPRLVVENPLHDIITQDESVFLSGRIQKEAHVTINGVAIDVARNGSFQDDILLQDGMNIIEVSAVNKFGKEAIVVRRVVKE